jgi:hypothetical protein
MWVCQLISVLPFIADITELPRDAIIIHRVSHVGETTPVFITVC